jgi:hypothetical protein
LWVVEALRANDGSATVVQVCQHIWRHHEEELRASGDLFYTWQYDVRWAATKLRKTGELRANAAGRPWSLRMRG